MHFISLGRTMQSKFRQFTLMRFEQILSSHDFMPLKGGFQLLDLIITELKSHMTCYNSMPLIGGNYSIQTGEQILSRICFDK